MKNCSYLMAVEDSLVQAKKLKKFLDLNGVESRFYTNAEEAYSNAVSEPPELVISDVIMPGMNGYEFCAKLKGNPDLQHIPVILLTSLSDPLDIIKGLQAGADNFITKPYDEDHLLLRINHLLINRSARGEDPSPDQLMITFRGSKYEINANKKQILNLLLSVYEAAIQRNEQLIRTQAELEASNEHLITANQELEAFSYTVSHDLRSPLNIVSGYTQLLKEDYGPLLDQEANDYLTRILASSFSMAKLIDDLLKFSRSGRMPVTPALVDLTAIADEIVSSMRESRKYPQTQFKRGEEMSASADPDLIRIVLDNLLGNAFKYSSKNPDAFVEFNCSVVRNEKIFYVRDNGAGFDMSESHRLFNPFQRFHTSQEFPGTGVGLATVRRIVERHGGKIWAESSPGHGATFFFTLG